MPTPTSKLDPLIKTNLILLLFFLIFSGLYFARTFLIPLVFAAILAMLMTPLCSKLEKKGVYRPLAAFICILLLLAFIFGLGALLSAQIASFSERIPQMEQQINQMFTQLQSYIKETFGISPEQQKDVVKQGSSSGMGSLGTIVTGILSSFTSIMAGSLLTLVYLFMLLFYRSMFSKFILMLVHDDNKEKARQIISNSTHIAQQYLVGRGLLMIILAILYSIGLTLIGLQNAILFSLIAALFTIIPYIGNIIGMIFPLFMALTQGGGSSMAIGVIVVFAVVQFVESYTLEPYVVGSEVDIHPFFTIVIIIVGELVWGIVGMILAIPLLGIVKIIFSNIDSMQPYAYLIGDNRDKNKSYISDKIKSWFSR